MLHTWPAPQAAPVPQWQLPPVQALPEVPQLAQVAPLVPQALALGVTQTPALQQPLGHEVASHTQVPPRQRWPAAQAAEPPQWQAPPWQLSAPAPHAPHAAPEPPHSAAVGTTHWFPLQQPVGHEVPSQRQAPLTQCSPLPHAPPMPQRQPPSEQLSAEAGSHAEQSAPPAPQFAAPGAWHAPLRQQPPSQLLAPQPLHAWFTHAWPPGHCWQATPPLPHAVPASPGRHWLPLQQPGQLVGSHTQAPATHFWPVPHAGPAPQLQPPSAHPSAFAPHAPQAAPWRPQAATVPVTHWPFSQQPFGQDAGVHWQTPETHCCPVPQAAFPPQPHTP